MQDTTPAERHPCRRPTPDGVTRRAIGRLGVAAVALLAVCAPATPARAQALVESAEARRTSDVSGNGRGAAGFALFAEASAHAVTPAPDHEAVDELNWDDYDQDPLERSDAEPAEPTGDAPDAAVPAVPAVAAYEIFLPSEPTVLPPDPEAAGSYASEPAPPVEPWTTDELDAWEEERVGPRYFDNVDHAGKPALFACVHAAAYFPHLLRRYDALGRCSFEEGRHARRQFGEDAQVFCTRPSFAGCRLLNGVERFYYAYGRRLRRTPRTWAAAAEDAADLTSATEVPDEDAAAGSAVTEEGATPDPAGAP